MQSFAMTDLGPEPGDAIELAERAGCKVLEAVRLFDGGWAYRVGCSSHDAKVAFLAELADYDARSPNVRRLAELVVAEASDTAEQAARLQAFVQQRVTFTGERDETFSPTMHTLAQGLGDCDDSARALMALARSLAIPTKLATLPEGGSVPLHVAPQVRIKGKWLWVEPSIAAELGEHPLAAARRLGVKTRPELGALNPDGPQPGLHWTPAQWAALGAGAATGLAAAYGSQPLALGVGAVFGGAVGYAFTSFPFVDDVRLPDGYECSSWLPQLDEDEGRLAECDAVYSKLRWRNGAIGAVATVALLALAWPYRWQQ